MPRVYTYSVDPGSDTAAANVLRFVGHGQNVLEIGAGPGSIARVLVERNQARLTALEVDQDDVAILQGFCDRVVQHDLNDPAWPAALGEGPGDARFDAVVIADVLEHLRDPWTVLRQAAGLLDTGGSIVLSLPHAGHATILGCLLDGDVRYGDWGLLDRTHIRFFGVKNVQALLEGAGLKVLDYAYVMRSPAQTEFADIWARIPDATSALLEQASFAHVYQIVVRAIPATDRPVLPGWKLPDRPPGHADALQFIAFYLPQFHPIPENDAAWGEGFTEWTNTAKAVPSFPGHYQPHLPAGLGYYDLRDRSVQREQVALAKRFGVDAFCFHYYWFNGRRVLERPLFDFLADPEAQIGFCLNWANENWTRRWDASDDDILLQQTYSAEGDVAFIAGVLPFFADARYVRVEGKPLLLVYRFQHMPEPLVTVSRWRRFCRDNGVGEIHVVACLTHGNTDFEQFGADAGVEFPPNNVMAPGLTAQVPGMDPAAYVVSFGDVAAEAMQRDYTKRPVYRTVFPSWDNTARFGTRALVVLDGNPPNYERWVRSAADRTVAERGRGDRLLFINAWNEWAEGCHLEPDERFGLAYLEATRRVKDGVSTVDAAFPGTVLPQPVVEGPQFGLRAGLLGARVLRRFPLAYRAARAIYRRTIKPA